MHETLKIPNESKHNSRKNNHNKKSKWAVTLDAMQSHSNIETIRYILSSWFLLDLFRCFFVDEKIMHIFILGTIKKEISWSDSGHTSCASSFYLFLNWMDCSKWTVKIARNVLSLRNVYFDFFHFNTAFSHRW